MPFFVPDKPYGVGRRYPLIRTELQLPRFPRRFSVVTPDIREVGRDIGFGVISHPNPQVRPAIGGRLDYPGLAYRMKPTPGTRVFKDIPIAYHNLIDEMAVHLDLPEVWGSNVEQVNRHVSNAEEETIPSLFITPGQVSYHRTLDDWLEHDDLQRLGRLVRQMNPDTSWQHASDVGIGSAVVADQGAQVSQIAPDGTFLIFDPASWERTGNTIIHYPGVDPSPI